MLFEFKTAVEDGTPVVLRFKPYGNAPGRISRRNIGNMEAQVWQYLEWGLEEPEHWPTDSILPGANVLDEIAQRDITKMYQDWQRTDDEDVKPKPPKATPKVIDSHASGD